MNDNNIYIDKFAEKTYDFTANKMNWSREWDHGGCYIHLEVSEFIEALRDKGDPMEELADVLIALFSVAHHYDLKTSEAIKKAEEKMENIINKRDKL